jgi:hypothetical protein
MKSIYLIAILSLLVMIQCSEDKNPVTPHETHNEAEGLLLKIGDAVIVTVREGEVKNGRIEVKAGESSGTIDAVFLDEDGDEFLPTEEGSSLAVEIENTGIAEFGIVAGEEWQFTIQGKAAGNTTCVIKLLHGDHADFITPPIAIDVTG